MATKEQKKLQKRKVREDQNRKNLLRRQTINQKAKKEERMRVLALKAEEKAENRANAQMLLSIQQQKSLESGMNMSPQALAVCEKIEEARKTYDSVKSKLSPEQAEQVLQNIAILEELKEEYMEAVEHRSQINQELEAQGAVSIQDKMKYLADKAREEFGEGCIDQIVCED